MRKPSAAAHRALGRVSAYPQPRVGDAVEEIVADLSLDKAMLQDVIRRKF